MLWEGNELPTERPFFLFSSLPDSIGDEDRSSHWWLGYSLKAELIELFHKVRGQNRGCFLLKLRYLYRLYERARMYGDMTTRSLQTTEILGTWMNQARRTETNQILTRFIFAFRHVPVQSIILSSYK